jgi:preprotein translocase subunit SecG
MYEIITVIIILVCLMLGFIVLIQNPKGGGLSATFGQAGNQLLGAQRSTDMVEKWTWGLATNAFLDSGPTNDPLNNVPGAFTPEADPTRAVTTPSAPVLNNATPAPIEDPAAEPE